MMMVICSIVKTITTHTHTHTHTHIQKKLKDKNKEFYSIKLLSVRTFVTHRDLYIPDTTSNLPRSACIIVHTPPKNHLYDHTQ